MVVIVRRPYPPAAAGAQVTAGSTTPHIAAAHPIETARQPTDSAAQPEAIRLLTAKPALVKRLGGRVAILAAATAPRAAWATGGTETTLPAETGAEALATARVEGEPTASAAGTFHAAVAGIGMRLEEVPGDMTARTLAPAAIAAPRAWDLVEVAASVVAAEVVSVAVAAVDAAGRPSMRKNHRSTA